MTKSWRTTTLGILAIIISLATGFQTSTKDEKNASIGDAAKERALAHHDRRRPRAGVGLILARDNKTSDEGPAPRPSDPSWPSSPHPGDRLP